VRTAEICRTRKLGVEHEFSIPLVGTGSHAAAREMIANVLTRNGLPTIARPYGQTLIQPPHVLAVEHDCSIRGEDRFEGISWIPVELKSGIITFEKWGEILPQALSVCSYLGGRATRSAGHHVHIGVPEVRSNPRIIRSLFNLFHRFEPVIYGLVPPSRQVSEYCRPIPPNCSKLLHSCRSLDDYHRALSRFDRHRGLNWRNMFSADPHLEIRYSGGTLDPIKAEAWLKFSVQMVSHAVSRHCQAARTQVARNRRGIDKLLTTVGFRPNSRIYSKVSKELRSVGRYLLMKRWRKFNAPEPRQSRSADDELRWASDL
jgi:Putative amidoligase enzyme